MPEQILVVGGTGDLGQQVVLSLRERGRDVRYLDRGSGRDGPLRASGAQPVAGDLTDAESLRSACEGVGTVVATATAMGRRLTGASKQSIATVDEAGMGSLVKEAEAAGVERFIYTSFAAVDEGVGSPLARAKLAVEHALRASSMQSVVVRPDAFQDLHLGPIGRFDLEHGKVAVIGTGATKRRLVSTADVAALMAAVCDEADPPPVVTFGGPELLSRNDAIEVAARALGRSLKVQRMPRSLARLGTRLLSTRNDALASVFAVGLHMDLVEAHWDEKALTDRGIVPRSVTGYIEDEVRRLRR